MLSYDIAVLVTAVWDNAADDALVNQFTRTQGDLLIRKAKAAGVYYPFVYLNDAAKGEKPYVFYGKGKSLPRMKQISRKYDPSGFFQQYEASGFKLS